jgi:carboxylesterase type B
VTAAELALSKAMQAYWGSFAASGTPAATGAAAWTQYEPGRDNHLVLDSATSAMADGVNTDRCDFWAALGV